PFRQPVLNRFAGERGIAGQQTLGHAVSAKARVEISVCKRYAVTAAICTIGLVGTRVGGRDIETIDVDATAYLGTVKRRFREQPVDYCLRVGRKLAEFDGLIAVGYENEIPARRRCAGIEDFSESC